MLSLLMNFVLMGFIVLASVKAYYDIPLLNENPKTSASVVLMIIFLLIWTFPKILGFLIKLAIFSSVLYAICHVMGWNLSFLKGNVSDTKNMAENVVEDTKKITETISDNVTDAINKVQEVVLPEQKFTVKSPEVVSGSQLKVGEETIHLYGIDAPDVEQSCKTSMGSSYNCGAFSKEELYKIVGKSELSCENKGKNRAGQKLAKCTVNGVDLGGLMVYSGWAVVDRKVTKDYMEEEKYAHDKKIGLWAGKFQAPWSWRLKHSKKSNAKAEKKAEKSKEDTPFQKLMGFFKK